MIHVRRQRLARGRTHPRLHPRPQANRSPPRRSPRFPRLRRFKYSFLSLPNWLVNAADSGFTEAETSVFVRYCILLRFCGILNHLLWGDYRLRGGPETTCNGATLDPFQHMDYSGIVCQCPLQDVISQISFRHDVAGVTLKALSEEDAVSPLTL